MAANPQDKVIQVQKPAQSLEHFQRSLGDEAGSPALRRALLVLGVAAAAGLGLVAWSTVRDRQVEKFEDSVAALRLEVEGDGLAPVPPAELEKRMRAALPRLEALAKDAPSPSRPTANGLVQSWKLALDGAGAVKGEPSGDAWARLREAQRLIALGQAKPASEQLLPLRAKASAEEPWAEAYWTAVLEADRLAGDRAQAVKDYGDYKDRFKKQGASPQMDKALQSI
ncbi:MAG TPA: hypothetical protein VJ483_09810 [Holophagaceae bacterium]|nr:hypothetical protein [Holophagaceae bacterium]